MMVRGQELWKVISLAEMARVEPSERDFPCGNRHQTTLTSFTVGRQTRTRSWLFATQEMSSHENQTILVS